MITIIINLRTKMATPRQSFLQSISSKIYFISCLGSLEMIVFFRYQIWFQKSRINDRLGFHYFMKSNINVLCLLTSLGIKI